MKSILKVLFLLLTMGLICHCKKDPGPIVEIPDKAFLKELIFWGVDTNGDGLISYIEAEVVTYLFIGHSIGDIGNIYNLKGIEAFINLEQLYCHFNRITSLDFSKNTALKGLYCQGNQLTSLNVTNNTSLNDLECRFNKLTSLDVTNNPSLRTLMCGWNQLSSLDLSKNTEIQLEQVHFLYYPLDLREMPSLHEVCVWTMPFPPDESSGVGTTGSPNIYFTTECSK